MRKFTIQASTTLAVHELNYNDQQWLGVITTPFETICENEDQALDRFHRSVPIKVLDDFDIEVFVES